MTHSFSTRRSSDLRLDRVEHVVLRHEAHLEVELIEFAGRAVGARILVAEAGRDLEIAVEARDHQQLLEHLGSLRQRIEFAGVDAARRSEEHTSELQSLMRISYAVFCLKKKT